MPVSRIFCLSIFVAVLSCRVLGVGVLAGESALRVEKGVEIPSNWSASQHLYVKGDVGISPGNLSELEAWLDENAGHWLVALLSDASGEVYTANGRSYLGLDAVEWALGPGLRNGTGFGKLEDPGSKLPDGAVFVIYLKEHKFSYIPSRHQNSFAAGNLNWRGELDQPAIAAMRSGGRIAEAVRETIKAVNAKVVRSVKRQEALKRKKQADRERTLQEMTAEIPLLEARIEKVQEASAAFGAANASATGDIGTPPAGQWQEDLDQARQSLAAKDLEEVRRLLKSSRDKIGNHEKALADYRAARPELEALRQKIESADARAEGVEDHELGAAREELERALAAYGRADSSFYGHMGEAQMRLDLAYASAERRRAAEARRLQNQRRWLMIGIVVLALLLVAAMIWIWIANRRRRPLKRQAEAISKSWADRFEDKTDELLAMMDRTSSVVGGMDEIRERGYTGETLERGIKTIRDVDELFIMSSAVDRVLDRARDLIHPAGAGGKLINFVSASRYEEALNLLRDTPLKFSPKDGISPSGQDKSGDEMEGGRGGKEEGFDLSFEELIRRFEEKSERAQGNLDLIEDAWATIVSSLDAVDRDIEGVELLEDKIETMAAEDGVFEVPSLYSAVLPAAREQLDEARTLGATDPVAALRQPGAEARRLVDEAGSVATIVTGFRGEPRERFLKSRETLEERGYLTGWFDDSLQQYSDSTEAFLSSAGDAPVTEEIAALELGLAQLVDRAERAVQLAVASQGKATEWIESAESNVEEARQYLGTRLGLDPALTLCERGANPTGRLREARLQKEAADTEINRGGTESASASIQSVREMTAEANAIVAKTRAACDEQGSRVEDLAKNLNRVDRELPEHAALLESLISRYARTALAMRSAENLTTVVGNSIENHAIEARDRLGRARAEHEKSQLDFRSGAILAASSRLDAAGRFLEEVDFFFQEIKSQNGNIECAERTNSETIARRTEEADSMAPAMRDRRTMASTRDSFEKVVRNLDELKRRILDTTVQRDPFLILDSLAKEGKNLELAQTKKSSDWDLHSETGRSLRAAEAQLNDASRQQDRARTDQIPDSGQISAAMETLKDLKAAFRDVSHNYGHRDHADWSEMDAEADRITQQAGHISAVLRNETEKAQAALSELQQAAGEVRRAAGWSGGYGVLLAGAPGSPSLERAREALSRGHYDDAGSQARRSRQEAESAVRQAEAEVQRLRAAEQARIQSARRARARRQRSMSSHRGTGFGSGPSSPSSRPSFGGGSSSSSSHSSHSSGASRSSFSSGSGASRSGW